MYAPKSVKDKKFYETIGRTFERYGSDAAQQILSTKEVVPKEVKHIHNVEKIFQAFKEVTEIKRLTAEDKRIFAGVCLMFCAPQVFKYSKGVPLLPRGLSVRIQQCLGVDRTMPRWYIDGAIAFYKNSEDFKLNIIHYTSLVKTKYYE